jgi:Flp pilus assembly protein TadD
VVRFAPDDARGWRNRGLMHLVKDDFEKALADYDQAIKLDPRDAYSFNNRGIARIGKGDRTGAIANFRKALILNPMLQQTRDQLKALGATP